MRLSVGERFSRFVVGPGPDRDRLKNLFCGVTGVHSCESFSLQNHTETEEYYIKKRQKLCKRLIESLKSAKNTLIRMDWYCVDGGNWVMQEQFHPLESVALLDNLDQEYTVLHLQYPSNSEDVPVLDPPGKISLLYTNPQSTILTIILCHPPWLFHNVY